MPKLTNTLTYSPGAWAMFQSCPRKFYLRRIVAWGGWGKSAPPRSRLAYRLSKMTNAWAITGNAAHEVIQQVLMRGELTKEAAVERYKDLVRSAWSASSSGLWQVDGPKESPPAFEHYYASALPTDHAKRMISMAAPRGRQAVEAIFHDDLLELHGVKDNLPLGGSAITIHSEDWQTVAFPGGFESRIRFDYALEGEKDGLKAIEVWDWKTGKPKEEDRTEQGRHYAFSACSLHDVGPGEVAIRFAYLTLHENPVITMDTYTQEDLDDYIETATNRFTELEQRWRLAHEDPERGEDFYPRTDNHDTCRRCDLFEACWGHRDLTRVQEAS